MSLCHQSCFPVHFYRCNQKTMPIDQTYLLASLFWSTSLTFCILLGSPVLGGGEFAFPSAYELISSTLNPKYNITGYAPEQMCQTVPGTNGTQWRALLNMIIDSMPTTALGIPQLTLELYSNSTPLTYVIDNARNINIVKQNGDNVTLIPIDGQSMFSFLATFHNVSNCSTITDNLTIQRNISYPNLSIQQHLHMKTDLSSNMPKYVLSSVIFSIILVHYGIYGCTLMGLQKLVFAQLRNAILTTSQELTYFIKIIISLSLLQFAISFGGLLYYCIMRTAPMPTYFLLMIARSISSAFIRFISHYKGY
ncbi:hypothetical protein THRCLA_00555 [Thraustotheca clavata]|uniref:Uncharacterized protein n=1 Tax=Thraustotheca clavata TaxID=74557 RepID=A0A1W0AB41_9STRA|nr:hypothetical protein THRCLA_00555 [Thraustotheca clavata]